MTPFGPGHPLVVIGGSAGAVTALRDLVGALPADLPACVLVVLHLPRAGGSTVLPGILDRAGPLPVRAARTGDPLTPGQVLVAPAERHLLVEDGHVVLSSGPAENGQRPSVDVLFRSAARSAGPGVIAVVLTGNLDDGSAGLAAVARHGGLTVVQDPEDAMFRGMPRNALAAVPDARTAPLAELAGLLDELVRGPAGPRPDLSADDVARDLLEVRSALGQALGAGQGQHPGQPSAFSCPDCTGVLFEIDDAPLPRYRCRVGHAWSAQALYERQERAVETALWVALRALEERQAMAEDVAAAAARSGRAWSAQHFRLRSDEASRHAAVLRALLIEDPGDPAPAPVELPELPVARDAAGPAA